MKPETQSVLWTGAGVLVVLVALVSIGAICYNALSLGPGEYSTAYATWVLALLTLLLALGLPITIQLASTQSKETSTLFLKQEKERLYAQLDAIYLDIQKMIVERPFLAIPSAPRDATEEIQYQAFAFIVWNFIESICDYSAEIVEPNGRSQSAISLTDTWDCIVKYEATLHAEWFDNEANRCKFKPSFRQKIGQLRKSKSWANPALASVSVTFISEIG